MNSRSTSRFSKLTSDLPLASIQESNSSKKHQIHLSKSLNHSYSKAEDIINILIEKGESIKTTEGNCNSYYKKIEEGFYKLFF